MELPLFPLQTVLFPGIPLVLHIFEERYKRMVKLCLESRTPFGVVLIQRGVEALGPLAEPHMIGCTAEILQTQALEEGRMNITALGKERFRIKRLDREVRPYLIGEVELYPLTTRDPAGLQENTENLRSLLRRFSGILEGAGKGHFDLKQMPEDPTLLAYMAASMLQAAPSKKQQLLSSPDALDLVTELNHLYRREVSLLRTMLRNKGVSSSNFSSN